MTVEQHRKEKSLTTIKELLKSIQSSTAAAETALGDVDDGSDLGHIDKGTELPFLFGFVCEPPPPPHHGDDPTKAAHKVKNEGVNKEHVQAALNQIKTIVALLDKALK